MEYPIEHFINGASSPSDAANYQAIINPATAQACGEVNFATDADVNRAVAAAKAAFPEWSQTSPLKRARILNRFRALLEEYQQTLAALVVREHGKTTADALGEVARAIELVEHTTAVAQQLRGTYSENVASNVDCYSLRQALGVCAGVSPFNFPVMVSAWLFAPAIACGNTFVLKPSEQDPAAPLFMAQLLQQAGCPDGVFNIVNGDKVAVDALCTHPDVKAVSAVASTPVAESIYHAATQNGKRSHTFGGAKNHAVVMPDADIDQAADALISAGFGSAGERCMAISVVVAVGDAVADALVKRFKRDIPKLTIGPGDTDVDIGPLISAAHHQRVQDYIGLGIDEGAHCVIDGREHTASAGFFIGPSLFDQVKPSMRIYQEEIFGPVLCIVRVDDFASALALVNENQFGNGTAIFTRDGDAARTYASQVQVGMVGINIPIPVPIAYHAFGGWKRSFFGDVPLHGDNAVMFYTQSKSITTRWPSGSRDSLSLAMPTHA